jgi:hypothetical protein
VENCLGVHREHIHDSMELTCSDEQSYQPKLQAYQTVFPNFKYKPSSFVYVEIGTNSRVPTTSSMVQVVTKLVSPPRGKLVKQVYLSYPYLFKLLLYLF